MANPRISPWVQVFLVSAVLRIIAALAWNLKSWFGQLMTEGRAGSAVMRMEYRRFLYAFIFIPAQIIRRGRRIVFRLLGYNSWLEHFFDTFNLVRRTKFA